ncbi:hypothetical protein [Puia dinghuensis]|uniref:BZIP transcription factor n=1 Tax=Puia dinghuensis TaxID=1792502 RepID=A0A8J2XQ01_9BACT|nr:hypothetical protein [Puia dinghuensis]GGA82727.1 hypothetical protein GCM10011511_02180 [Puia dinghuensis]
MQPRLSRAATLLCILVTQTLHAQWQTSGSNIYYNNGDVGIGTTNFSHKLEILTTADNDGIRLSTGTGVVMLHTNSLVLGGYNNITAAGDGGIVYGSTTPQTTNNGFVITPWSPGITGIRLDQNGNVGIATRNTFGYQLAVNGSAIFTKIVVKPYANWPDYVFQKNYHLPSLNSVAAFIRTNHHLPGVPSADSVTQSGIDVGQNQALLLKKIEELTLYVIRLDKENQRLRRKIDRLSTAVPGNVRKK